MEEKEINNLIVAYQQGDESALESICKEFLPILTTMSEQVWYKVKNSAEMECWCLMQLRYTLKKFDPKKGKARNLIINTIVRQRSKFLKGNRGGEYKESISIESLAKEDDDGNVIPFENYDVLANVTEEYVIENDSLKEKIALLAQGDTIKLAILNAWNDGIYNDLELSRMLAHSFNGNQESYRKYIQRFRTSCKNKLTKSKDA